MAKRPPKYENNLSDFLGDLRSLLFSSQSKAADFFHVSRPTITRYENGTHRPPLGYLAALARLLGERQAETDPAYQENLLRQVNQAIRHSYHDLPFQTWAELSAIADEYLAGQPASPAAATPDKTQPHPVPMAALAGLPPAEVPPLPHFYVERAAIQNDLLHRFRQERSQTLVLWGQGGTGKSTLAAWLARIIADDSSSGGFSDGQIWIELPDSLKPEETILEVQTRIARSFGVTLSSTSVEERAGQLRTLLQDKQCLLILDNIWLTSDLIHLQVVNEKSCLILTTRYRKLADVVEAPFIRINGMTVNEGLALLTKWAGYPVTVSQLVERLGGLPLALKLSGVQLRDHKRPEDLLGYFDQANVDLSRLDLDDPQNTAESLIPCFDQSFNRLTAEEKLRFVQLGCFVGSFEVIDSARIWRVSIDIARRSLHRLSSLALLEGERTRYQLHPLLRDYAYQKLLASPPDSQITHRRYTAHYIAHYLYHPQVLDDVTDKAPELDLAWGDVVAGVKWAVEHAPQLAAIAVLVAHTERPALLETVGPALIAAVETYLSEAVDNSPEQAILHELLGDLGVLNDDLLAGLDHFDQAASLWQIKGDNLASSRARLRIAGIYLLRQDQLAAVEALTQAQSALEKSLPIRETNLEKARWLFYWFDIIYSVLVKYQDVVDLENTVMAFVDLAQKTNHPILEARGWHIGRKYTTNLPIQTKKTVQKARQYGARAVWLWWRHGERDKALTEVMWTQEQTKSRRSRSMARNFAQRLSRATPELSQEQIKIIKDERVRWWLQANEEERITWLVKHLPPPGNEDWHALDDILHIGTMGEHIRRLAKGLSRPDKHLVSEPLWKVLTGQRALPLAGEDEVKLVKHYLTILEKELL